MLVTQEKAETVSRKPPPAFTHSPKNSHLHTHAETLCHICNESYDFQNLRTAPTSPTAKVAIADHT